MRKKIDKHLKSVRESINPAIRDMGRLRMLLGVTRVCLENKLAPRYSVQEINRCYGKIVRDYYLYLKAGLRRKHYAVAKPTVPEIGMIREMDVPQMERDYMDYFREMDLEHTIRTVLKSLLLYRS